MNNFLVAMCLIFSSSMALASDNVTKSFNKETGVIEWSVSDRRVFTLDAYCNIDRPFSSSDYDFSWVDKMYSFVFGWEEKYTLSCNPNIRSKHTYEDKAYFYAFNGKEIDRNQYYNSYAPQHYFSGFHSSEQELDLFLESEKRGESIALHMESKDANYDSGLRVNKKGGLERGEARWVPVREIDATIDPSGTAEALDIQMTLAKAKHEALNHEVYVKNKNGLIAKLLALASILLLVFLMRGIIRRTVKTLWSFIVGSVFFVVGIVIGLFRLPFALLRVVQRHRIQRIIVEEEIRAEARANAEAKYKKRLGD
ncbi:hypothetical protein PTW35_06765 [Photobacterium sp. DA100]|uniref:hypothetical protein n=1 Tax=Photobacterium sp. DA100 TaxID=3027472 RepID=UPI0024786937|nr:hypothetical protein [Photobacterium sp. DA100]WEM43487.1 hypothetical protein PTW35_06765 [Photobacterium sp. DA100]